MILRLLSIVVLWLTVSLAMAEEPANPPMRARLVALEVTLAEFDPSLSSTEETAEGGKLLKSLLSAEAREKVFSLSQLRLSTLENQAATVHFGERVAVPAGRTSSATAAARSGFASATNYVRESLGTIVGATCRVDEGGVIVLELDVEQSRLAADSEVKLDPADPDASAMLKPVTRKMQTTVSIKDGETLVVSGIVHKVGKQLRQEALLVTARVAETLPVKTVGAVPPKKVVKGPAVQTPVASSPAIDERLQRYAQTKLAQYDTSGDGVLSAVEFSKFERPPANADRDKDGTVTAEELAEAYARRE